MKNLLYRMSSVVMIVALLSLMPSAPVTVKTTEAMSAPAAALQKAANGKGVTRADLDRTLAVLIGKAGFYQLTDGEGGTDFNAFGQFVPFGRKSYAKITGIPLAVNANGSFVTEQFTDVNGDERTRYFFRRDANGNILLNLHIERDPAKGGAFDKENVPYTGGRFMGTFDIIGTGDLVGL